MWREPRAGIYDQPARTALTRLADAIWQFSSGMRREALVNVRFGTHCGLKSDIAPSPKSADFVAKVC
jgi:hypothetical protein